MLFCDITLIDENFQVLEHQYVGTKKDKINYIGADVPEDAEQYGDRYDGRGKLLMPGFYNAHAHSPMSILRGYGEGLPLDRWLNERIFPFEAKLDDEAVYWGTLVSMAESIRTGIVSTTDMYLFGEPIVRAIEESGTKNNLCRCVTCFTGEAPEDNSTFREMQALCLEYDGAADGRILTDAGLHAEYTNDDRTIRAVAEYARENGLRVHAHVAETESETRECRERHNGQSPVEYLADCGLFDTRANAAHCVWLTNHDREILRDKDVTVASNPISNLKLTSGICDVPALYRAGVNVTIGTDGPSSNNSLNFFEEMKTFALLGKYRSGDAAAMTPEQVLYSATAGGARYQGRADCGSIRIGNRADLIVLDLMTPEMQPCHDLLNNVIYSASPADLVLTMVDGNVLYQDGEYRTIDLEKALAELNAAKDRILGNL